MIDTDDTEVIERTDDGPSRLDGRARGGPTLLTTIRSNLALPNFAVAASHPPAGLLSVQFGDSM